MTYSTNHHSKSVWKMLFVISLALNLLVIGAVIGIKIRMDKAPMINNIAPGTIYMRALDLRERRALRKKILQNNNGSKLDKSVSTANLRTAVGILRRQPFDRGAFEDLLDKQKEDANSTQNSARTVLITHIENMTVADRLIYAQRLEDLFD